MLTKDVIKHFKGKAAVAAALGIEKPSVYGWGKIVPALRQIQLELITKGALKADPKVFERPTAQQRRPTATSRRRVAA